MTVLHAVGAMIVRDLRLILRRPSRIAATLLTPTLIWAFFAAGFSGSLGETAQHQSAYTLSLAAGAALLVVTFASIFGALGLIRDRESGYLQAVLVGPTPRWAVIVARVASGVVIAVGQAMTMLGAAMIFGEGVGPLDLAGATAAILLTAIGLCGACTALAWHFRSIEGFHGIMAGVLLPAWLLSGSVFPPGESGVVLGVLMAVNPLTWCHATIAGFLGAMPLSAVSVSLVVAFGVFGPVCAVTAARGDAKR
ncbi:MAG: ABC transporter permease [Planctomycetota bacterium]